MIDVYKNLQLPYAYNGFEFVFHGPQHICVKIVHIFKTMCLQVHSRNTHALESRLVTDKTVTL